MKYEDGFKNQQYGRPDRSKVTFDEIVVRQPTTGELDVSVGLLYEKLKIWNLVESVAELKPILLKLRYLTILYGFNSQVGELIHGPKKSPHAEIYGYYPSIATLPHSCSPNTCLVHLASYLNSGEVVGPKLQVRALKHIDTEKDIVTHSITRLLIPKEERAELLLEAIGYSCDQNCKRCQDDDSDYKKWLEFNRRRDVAERTGRHMEVIEIFMKQVDCVKKVCDYDITMIKHYCFIYHILHNKLFAPPIRQTIGKNYLMKICRDAIRCCDVVLDKSTQVYAQYTGFFQALLDLLINRPSDFSEISNFGLDLSV
jgi:hypothetical protein